MTTTRRKESAGATATAQSQNRLILVADFKPLDQIDERSNSELRALATSLAAVNWESLHGFGVTEAIIRLSAAIASAMPDLLILSLSDDAQASAPSIFRGLFSQVHCPLLVVVPASVEPSSINDLYRLGASDYLTPPFRAADVQPRLLRLLDLRLAESTPSHRVRERLGLQQFVGGSAALLEQIGKIPRIARCDACVFITGETGTGKEVCARVIHYLSPRADSPFVPLNCGAIPVDLVENELFGHEAGAFTSAHASHAGILGQAQGGTLFLDEIDSLPLSAQVKLLRFLQDKEYRPPGARKAAKADVRIIAASNGSIGELVNSGKLRQDLFYRLNVLPLHLPPLRQRREDIPLLTRHFVAKYAAETGGAVRDIAPAALHKLSLHDWPGNVRELENVIERAVVLSPTNIIRSDDIDLPIDAERQSGFLAFGLLKARVVAEFERNYLRTLLEHHRGNIAQAARAAQKNRRVFFQLMRKHHIRVEPSAPAGGDGAMVNVVIAVDNNVHPQIRP